MIQTSLKNLLRNKVRSLLTSLGIIIGVAVIISLVSISEGLKQEANSQLGGAEYIQISNSITGATSTLNTDLLKRLDKINDVEIYASEISFYIKSFNGKDLSASSSAAAGTIQLIQGIGLEPEKIPYFKNALPYDNKLQGRLLFKNEKNGVMINDKFAKDENLFVGNSVEINGRTFRIVGIFTLETSIGASGTIVMNIDTARELSNYKEDEFSSVYLLPKIETKTLFLRLKEIFSEYRVSSSQQSGQSLNNFLGTLTVALWFVSSISAFVGGIGIMNTMLMSVMERINEFGVLKAIGWKDIHITYMILLEAVLLGLTGGVIGTLLGLIGSYLVEKLTSIPTIVSFGLIIQAMIFAVFVGVISSLYPASVASKMSPVEAVRYE
ncbi:MAG: FtsX-like permease family protein [Candidatus Nanoarchaeia archaeon]|jgi:putative ABC transport system permease protein